MQRWIPHVDQHAVLVALDVCGFSLHREFPPLIWHRQGLFECVNQTSLFFQAGRDGTASVHFLGDELRIAFQPPVTPLHVADFLREVFRNLRRRNAGFALGARTSVRALALAGPVRLRIWRVCCYLNGPLVSTVHEWMSNVGESEIAINAEFKMGLEMQLALPPDVQPRDFPNGQQGWIFRP